MTSPQTRRKLLLDGCQRCGGDLIRDEADYVCLQCGRPVVGPKEVHEATSAGTMRLPILEATGKKREDAA